MTTRRLRLLTLLLALALPLLAQPAADIRLREWPLDGTLAERHGHAPFHLDNPQFTPAPNAALILDKSFVATTNDDDILLPRPGFRLSLRFTLSTTTGLDDYGTYIVHKGKRSFSDTYFLRVDPRNEGQRLSFFLNLDGSVEPRVSTNFAVQPNVPYDVDIRWDGSELAMTVNGQTSRIRRTGQPHQTCTPLTLGPFPGTLARLRVENPTHDVRPVAHWPFRDSLQDISGNGHHFAPPTPLFPQLQTADGTITDVARALSLAPLSTPDTPDLRLIPGFELSCAVQFAEKPLGETIIAYKKNDYLLRYDPKGKSGAFTCFLFLNGSWEPRLAHTIDIEPHTWYNLHVRWDGLNALFEVNGRSATIKRKGNRTPSDAPLTLGAFNGLIRDLVISTQPTQQLTLDRLRTRELLPFAGQTVTLSGDLTSIGRDLEGATVTVTPRNASSPITITPATLTLPRLTNDRPHRLEWQLSSPTDTHEYLRITVRTPNGVTKSFDYIATFMPAKEPDYSARAWNPPTGTVPDAKTFHIDSRNGDNRHDGLSPQTAWRDFTPINGKTLQPGERLLLRRGSTFNQELRLSAQGTPQAWAEINAYGDGPRPIIARNRDIDEACATITNPDYLAIRNLVVANAGSGLSVLYTSSSHAGLLIENCLAHHIEGRYRFNSHGIPEWLNRGQGRGPGFAFGRSGLKPPIVFRDNEMYQCSTAFAAVGSNVFIDRVFCHDNFCHNTSPHPFATSLNRSYILNSIFDAAGWNAAAGTMGIMLGHNRGFIIRNSHFLNQPDSGSHDEGGIDFECDGENNLIDSCTFRRNAGAAIEVLGLRTPQTRNIEIRNCRFDQNNQALKLGPAEIFIWSGSKDPTIVCSNGLIRDNAYVLKEGVQFFVNKATPGYTDWKLENNRQLASSDELNRAIPLNDPPVPEPIPEIWTTQTADLPLRTTVSDDRHPDGPALTLTWSQLDGPANVAFSATDRADTTASFPAIGDYRLLLKADDGQLWRTTRTAVHILPPGTAVHRAWAFSRNLDKEGWTSHGLGTVKETFTSADSFWNTFAEPVDIASGDYYVFAIKNADKPALLSPDQLGLDAASTRRLTLRLQNHTNATQLLVSFRLNGQDDWTQTQTQTLTLPLVPHDQQDTLYHLDLDQSPAWKGTLRQLRLQFRAPDGQTVTGTCRLDYLWLGAQAN